MTTMANRTRAAELVKAITAVPGVRGIEPGIASTMRTLDARVRAGGTAYSRFGVVIDAEGSSITVEVGLDGSLPVRKVVRDIQEAALRALGGHDAGTGAGTDAGTAGTAGTAGSAGTPTAGGPQATGPTTAAGPTASGRAAGGPAVTVRVQSLSG